MDDPLLIALFAIARAVHFGACLLMLCAPLFDRLMVAPLPVAACDCAGGFWNRTATRLMLIGGALAPISGVAWLGLVAIEMSALPPAEALTREMLEIVLNQTRFGQLWKIRALFWLLAGVLGFLAFSFRRPRSARDSATEPAERGAAEPAQRGAAQAVEPSADSESFWSAAICWMAALSAGALCASLAWAGHGLSASPVPLHLPADVLHLLICAIWPVGLLPLLLLLWRLRRSNDPSAGGAIGALTRRFSAAAFISVLLLTGSGFLNTGALVGSVSNLWTTRYGKLLCLKIFLFLLMVVIGARNMLRWKPLLLRTDAGASARTAATKLQRNVFAELLLAIAITWIVGYLGMMAPANHERHMQHLAEENARSSPAAASEGR